MKLCTSYYQNDIYRKKVDQIRFSMHALNPALEYVMRNPEKEIIIEILDLNEQKDNKNVCPSLSKMKSLQQTYNIIYDFYSLDDLLAYAQNCHEDTDEECLHYKCMYHFPVATFNMARVLLAIGVSDMVIGEPLIFQRNDIINFIKPHVTIRAYPHKGQPDLAYKAGLSPIRHFFILPQHIDKYDYIDVLDILDDNIVRESALIDVYTKPRYDFSLSFLLPYMTGHNITGAFIDELFVEKRMNCGQRCMRHPHACHYCDAQETMYETMKHRFTDNIEPADGES